MSLHVVFSPDYVAELPAGHRFPMPKFGLLMELLRTDALVASAGEHRPELADARMLGLAHTDAYVAAVLAGRLDLRSQRRIGFPLSESVVRRSRSAVGGTLLAARLALEHGIAFNMAGGSHHAFGDHGGGFCVFNDVAVAARVLLVEGCVQRILVLDLDVHQGDGTAAIFDGDDAVFTFSVHCEANYPARKQRSDLDVGLAAGTADEAYLESTAAHLLQAIERQRPQLVFYNGGVDPHRDDRLGLLSLSDEGLRAREQLVLDTCRAYGLPLACVLGGGYADDVGDVVRRHAFLHRLAAAG